MIAIGDILVSDQVIQEQFVCNISKCKGACCADGDAGAPLADDEMEILVENYEQIAPYLTPAGKAVIEKQGKYNYDKDFGWVTPVISGEMCAYGFVDAHGAIKCGIEQAYHDGRLKWKKPISCHLFPIRISKSRTGESIEMVNYEPRPDNCKPACKLGKELKVPVYKFLKEAIERKYGTEFYETLDAVAAHVSNKSK